MRRLRRTVLLVAAASVIGVWAASYASLSRYREVNQYLDKGELAMAASELRYVIDRDSVDGEGLYWASRLESRGDLSVEKLQRGLELCNDSCGDIVSELADAYYAWGRYQDVVLLYRQYRDRLDRKPENLKFFWFAGMSYIRMDQHSSADRVFEEIENRYDRDGLSPWGTLGRGSVRAERGDIEDAMSILKPLGSAADEVAALAVYNEALMAARTGDDRDALFGYDILYQQYGEFLGSAELTSILLEARTGRTGGTVERLVDVTYTVEMGVFGDKSEADRLVGKLKAGGWSVDTKTRVTADRRYWLVRVGVFRSQQAAQETKDKLEELFQGAYRVVIR